MLSWFMIKDSDCLSEYDRNMPWQIAKDLEDDKTYKCGDAKNSLFFSNWDYQEMPEKRPG